MSSAEPQIPYERRRFPRVYRHQHGEVSQEDGMRIAIQVMNISAEGVRFVSRVPLLRDAQITLHLGEQSIAGSVCECRQLYSGYTVRVKFSAPLSLP